MNARKLLGYIWKIPVIGIVMTIGLIVGSMLPTLLGMPAPVLPEGIAMNTLFAYYLLGNIVLGLALSLVSRGVSGRWAVRWLVLAALTWLAQVTMYIEAGIYMASDGMGSLNSALFNIVANIVPSLLGAALVTALFHPQDTVRPLADSIRGFFARYSTGEWAGRLVAALLAYPVIYIFFGLLVIPATYSFYAEGAFGLSAPTWGQVIPIQIARSVLLLLASLPVLACWERSRRSLFFSLGLGLWVLIGLMWTVMSYWMDPGMRVVHSLEVFADAMLYTGVLVTLFKPQGSSEKSFEGKYAAA